MNGASRGGVASVGLILLAACSRGGGAQAVGGPGVEPASAVAAPSSSPAEASTDAGVTGGAEPDAGAPAADDSYREIVQVLGSEPAACAAMSGDARVRCALDERFADDREAASLANELWSKWRTVAGVEVAHVMDGGYRGAIRIEPALPVQAERRHLEWVVRGMRDLDRVMSDLAARAGGAPLRRYRFHPLMLRFMRSMDGKRTPSAYAHDWTVAYNLRGSLNTSADAVRETMVHEIFHLNDRAHAGAGETWWSERALGADYDAIVKRCGTALRCLAPFTPNGTTVRGGTYYSFQPGNGVVEYAAELALRYYREQRAVMLRLAQVPPFKCGPKENGRAWAAMKDEFFGGIDLVPACPAPR